MGEGEGGKGSSEGEGEGCSEMAIRFWGFFPVSVLAGGLAGSPSLTLTTHPPTAHHSLTPSPTHPLTHPPQLTLPLTRLLLLAMKRKRSISTLRFFVTNQGIGTNHMVG